MLRYIPAYFTNKAIVLYIVILFAVNLIFRENALPITWWIFGLVEVLSFFYFSNLFTRKWTGLTEKQVKKKLFNTAILIRISWVIFSYFFYVSNTGQPFEFAAGDVLFYHDLASEISNAGLGGFGYAFKDIALSDSGYPGYLSVIYLIFGNGVLVPRLIKALLGSLVVLLIYKMSKRNFGEDVARMAGIFVMLMPNLIYYSGSHMKEAEMVFLTVLLLERVDYYLHNKKLQLKQLVLIVLLLVSLFTFRTALGIVGLFAIVTALFFSSNKIVRFNQRIILLLWLSIAFLFVAGGKISSEVEELWENRQTNQSDSYAWRAVREGGNHFAIYASKSVLAPAIFIIPLPTIVNVEHQQNQMLIHGGNYVKNIMAFFVMFAILWIVRNKKWKDFTLIGSFTLAYLIVIAISSFAHSERFHQPALPFLLILAAVGVNKITNKEKQIFQLYMVFIILAIVAWSWFKLAGRGLI